MVCLRRGGEGRPSPWGGGDNEGELDGINVEDRAVRAALTAGFTGSMEGSAPSTWLGSLGLRAIHNRVSRAVFEQPGMRPWMAAR